MDAVFNRQSAFLWVPTVLPLSAICTFVHTTQAFLVGFVLLIFFSFLCCLYNVFVFVLFLVCLMLSVSLDYPFFIASSVLSTVYFAFLHLPIVPIISYSVPDLPLCLGVLKHRAPLARGTHLPANFFLRWIFAYKMWCNFNILTIPTFPQHVCLTACVGLPGLPPTELKWGAS